MEFRFKIKLEDWRRKNFVICFDEDLISTLLPSRFGLIITENVKETMNELLKNKSKILEKPINVKSS